MAVRRALLHGYARELREASAAQEASTSQRTAQAASRYQLGAQIGTGGMAEVYAGTMIGAEGFVRQVAIKRVRSSLAEIPAFARMFIAEAQIASRLAHPNIVSVLDFTRDPEDRLFLVMEHIDGKDLASVLATGPVPTSLAIFIVIEMLRALDYAHDLPHAEGGTRGVIHRDVSPQNLLLSYEGAVKVSDFGLAKVRVASDGVRSETVRGKPSYMAPEQMAGQLLDGRADLYAVGVMLWEMLAQQPLYVGTTPEIMAQALFKDLPRPSSARRGVPADVEAIAMRLLARDPDHRPASAELAIEALLQCADAPRDGRGELA
ncbi:MAG: serine/threonine protein kinase, partial [Myxococcales bacterium]|nr:serine/threonine protein kinase [Myxococcales bacterium]